MASKNSETLQPWELTEDDKSLLLNFRKTSVKPEEASNIAPTRVRHRVLLRTHGPDDGESLQELTQERRSYNLTSKSVSLWNAVKCCISTAFLCIGLTMLVDTIMWGRVLWPELETHAFHWYFTSALPRSLLVAYPLCMLAALLDRRIWQYIVPVFSFVLLYSKLPHKELRFIIGAIPIFNVSAAITASRIYKNRKKTLWRWLYIMMLVSILVSLGCSIMTFMASYENYPGGYALKTLHRAVGSVNTTRDKWVHIDPFAAMNGVSRFLENNSPWRYSKEEGITLAAYHTRNFAYLLSEHSKIDGFQCLFSVDGFSKVHLGIGFPPIVTLKEPKVYVHGNIRHEDVAHSNWSGCP
ncbi:hypothetical protein J5N97_029674 [Dioscorea zingiberensis]|uniref:Mannosyltransferase n=1 Tax=Dioscorea zingiberensis TaxID=325984 RepID=A0A9D5H3J0_9LILI|nr:hypothetical protein J5N97_029674 [Dioscorea zingiberensis]